MTVGSAVLSTRYVNPVIFAVGGFEDELVEVGYLWFMVHGSRFMVHGSISVHDPRFMVHDSWFKVNGS